MNQLINILIVDDEPKARYALGRLFAIIEGEKTYRVFGASDGASAVEVLSREPIDAVLLDIQMPGGSGLEWLPRLLETRPTAAVIMATGVSDVDKAVRAMKDGATDYLLKGSISPWAVGQMITNAVEKVALRRELRQQQERLRFLERHRIMTESLGSVCHHISQPMTILTSCLELMKNIKGENHVSELLDESLEAANRVTQLLDKFQKLCLYRTEPYLPGHDIVAITPAA
jgi:DNA-binding NtrC family response regulator